MIDGRVRDVLARLEAEDVRDEEERRPERSLAIAATSGALLYALCARRDRCAVLELGGSRGYSTIWLGAAVRGRGGTVLSVDADPSKVAQATRNLADAGLGSVVEVVEADAFALLPSLTGPFDVVFLDAWKHDYEALFALVRPLLSDDALVVADNVLSHVETLAAYSAARQSDPACVSVTVPLDNGLELTCIRTRAVHSD
jgi:predicted O-methyltransferase YrrM